ncbi:MAG: hypothetical protein ACK4YO_03430, partial [Candidatus Altarchaeaceae archaeon]
MIADQANPNNTLDILFNVSNNIPWQEKALAAYNITIYDEFPNSVKIWDFNRWNNTPNNTKVQYVCINGTNGTLNIIENNNDLDNGIINFTVDGGLPENCSLFFNVSVTYQPPCASNLSFYNTTYRACDPYWNDSSVYDQSNHYYILNLKPKVMSLNFNWNEGNNLTEEVRWKKPYFNISKTANVSTAEPGDYVNFTITVTNIGNSTIYELRVWDMFPQDFVPISWNSSFGNDRIRIEYWNYYSTSFWRIWNLTVGETVIINITVYVKSSAGNVSGKINENKIGVYTNMYSYEDDSTHYKSTSTNVTVYTPNIKVSKIGKDPTQPGDYATWKITVNNLNLTQDHATLYNISIKDVLPKCFVYNNTINITYYRKDGICSYARFPGPPNGETNASNVVNTTTIGNYTNVTWNLTKILNLSNCSGTMFNDSQLHPN